MALNATINGGNFLRPHMVKEILDSKNNVVKTIEPQTVARVLSEETSSTMREYFENNSKDSYHFKENPLRIGHKTGTTEVVNGKNVLDDREKSEEDPLSTITSIYAAYPSDAPKYSVFIVTAFPQKDLLASYLSPLAKDILESINQFDNSKAPAEITKKDLVKIPNVVGKPIYEAREILRPKNLNLDYNNKNNNEYEIITKQYPEADGYIAKDGTIEVDFDPNGDMIVPNVTNKKLNDAKDFLKQNNIKFEVIEGGDSVVKQYPQAGSKIKKNEKIKLSTTDN